MDKTTTNFPEKQTWGTCEELLLACAVHRYGTDNWSSVAAQVQKRSSSTLQFLTPHSCRDKYHDLKRRFAHYDAVSVTDNPDIPWLDELKKLRVAELKSEVERYDLSIVSLQSKVQKLKEDREQSLIEKETQYLSPEKTVEHVNKNNERKNSGEESDQENRSVNESNSTDPKIEDTEKGPEPEEPAAPQAENAGEDIKTVKEDSCNVSCGSTAKESARNSERVDSTELRESVAESRDGGEERNGKERDTSDVQSSASLSRKEEKGDEPNETKEPEIEENQSLTIKCVSVESQPLIECLEIVRSHKLCSIFERRLHVQETPDYQNIIRQHVDIETVRMRVEESWYSGCNSSFFRDLLLVFNNAIVFFEKNSSEYLAAIELRQVVLKEMDLKTSNPNQLPKEKSSVSSASQNLKLDIESSDSLLLKPNISLPLIACRKRSSISARGFASSSGADKKRELTASSIDKKPVLDWKKHDKSSVMTDLEHVTMKRTRERSASGTRSSSKNAKSRANPKTKRNEDVNTKVDHSSELGFTDNESSEAKAEKGRKNNTDVNAKKRSAANFLSRITRSSPLKNGSLLETLKNPVISSNGRKGAEQKKNSSGKSDSRKDQNLQTHCDGKGAKEKESPTKRTKGRPARKAAAPLPPVSAACGKRRREGSELESTASGRARNRSRNR
ncbi:hypothetical protein Ddye_018793 [Dipteronia dyeriana]|uniref:Bromo domain-containing protein n=1 Tax=Dipteronia dyeriana TaxID=168575 RepID=A0AAD9UC00_9ROSI|nr:hypothetical protein Ddye_018793 [Dipteronia dyeriana]